jgi:hypothetical protein
MHMGMLNGRDSRGTGYVLAIVGVAAALAVLVIGACVIVAVGHSVPTELWGIGGALSGALVGILAPPPRSGSPDKEGALLISAEKTIDAAKRAAKDQAETETTTGEATIAGAQTAREALTAHGETIKDELANDGDPRLAGSPAEAAKHIVESLQTLQPAPGGSGARLEAERSVHRAALKAGEDTAAAHPDENKEAGAATAKLVAEAVLQAALDAAQTQADSSRLVGRSAIDAAKTAAQEVEHAGEATREQFADQPAADTIGTGVPAAALKAAMIASRTQPAQQIAPAGDAAAKAVREAQTAAAERVHSAASEAAKREAEAAPSADRSWAAGLKTIVTEPKISLPLILFAITLGLGLALALGAIHITSVCDPTLTPKEHSACSDYTTTTSQAANVLISLAAATVGALVGIFAGHPGEQRNTPAPKGG